jgi:hypothetical protein
MLKTDFMEKDPSAAILGYRRFIAQKKTAELLTTSQLSAHSVCVRRRFPRSASFQVFHVARQRALMIEPVAVLYVIARAQDRV